MTVMAVAMTTAVAATRVAVLSDVHVVPGNECDSALRVAVGTINRMADVDLVVMDGDLTNEGSDEQLRHVKEILDGITRPAVILPGNHENNWSQSATATFPELWGNDRFVTTVGDSLIAIGINCGPYMKMGDGHVKQEDLHWLNATLGELTARYPRARVLSFCHYPLNADLDNVTDYELTLSRFPVMAHVNGHYHQWQHYRSASGRHDCVSVRALEMKNDANRFGFTLLDIDGDSMTVYNVAADGSDIVPVYTFTPMTDESATPTRPAIADRITLPGGAEAVKVWADSASIFTRVGLDSANVYFATSTGMIKGVDRKTGAIRWETPTAGRALFAKPTVAAGKLYVPTTRDGILALNPADGSIIERIDTDGRPVVADGLLHNGALYQGGMKSMRRIDPATGRVVWCLDSIIGNYCQAMPAADGTDLVFGAWDSYLYCVDTETGRLKWRWNNGREVNMLGPGNVVPIVNASKIVIVAPDRYMTAIDRKTGRTLWRDNSVKYREALGSDATGTTALAKTMDGELIAVDITGNDYRRRWIADMGIGYDHAPCIVAVHPAANLAIAGSRRGIVTAVDLATGTVAWQATLGSSEVNGIEIDPVTGVVYLSLFEGTVWKIAGL